MQLLFVIWAGTTLAGWQTEVSSVHCNNEGGSNKSIMYEMLLCYLPLKMALLLPSQLLRLYLLTRPKVMAGAAETKPLGKWHAETIF